MNMQLISFLIFRDATWNYNETCLANIKEKIESFGFSRTEQKHLEEIHNFIEKHELGVSMDCLMVNFSISFTKKLLPFSKIGLLCFST